MEGVANPSLHKHQINILDAVFNTSCITPSFHHKSDVKFNNIANIIFFFYQARSTKTCPNSRTIGINLVLIGLIMELFSK